MTTRAIAFLSYSMLICPRNEAARQLEVLEQDFRVVFGAWWREQGREVLSVASAAVSPAKRIVGQYPHRDLDEQTALSVSGHFASPHWNEHSEQRELTTEELESVFDGLVKFIQASGRIDVAAPRVVRD